MDDVLKNSADFTYKAAYFVVLLVLSLYFVVLLFRFVLLFWIATCVKEFLLFLAKRKFDGKFFYLK